MFEGLLESIDASALAVHLRHSTWLYPLVNAAHILGIALLVGGIAPVDAKLLGLWRAVPLAFFARTVLPFAFGGAVLAIVAGALLFIVQPADYAALPVFWLKIALVLAGLANALLLHRSRAWHAQLARADAAPPPARLRIGGALSLLIWLAVLLLG
ncbi:hypothetical protein, partial [Aromatoleum sp.]|uniref:hypothetical protein n=1 Tax=Aromatoleum sp. TaxID=2307007 RepID=UPI002FC6AB15